MYVTIYFRREKTTSKSALQWTITAITAQSQSRFTERKVLDRSRWRKEKVKEGNRVRRAKKWEKICSSPEDQHPVKHILKDIIQDACTGKYTSTCFCVLSGIVYKLDGYHVPNGEIQPKIHDATACLYSCVDTKFCSGFDFNFR